MGFINWTMHRNMRRLAAELSKWAVESHEATRRQHPDWSDREIQRSMLDGKGITFDVGDSSRETFLDRYGSSLNGLCYFLGLTGGPMKDATVLRCVQFTEYVDIELQKHGATKISDDIKRGYFKLLGLPEATVNECCLRPQQ
jgi:hypothetical protein